MPPGRIFQDFLVNKDADEADPALADTTQDEAAKNTKKKQELDFEGYAQFLNHLITALGFVPLLEREARILREEMERARLRCAVNYEYAYKAVAAPRTLPQVCHESALCC